MVNRRSHRVVVKLIDVPVGGVCRQDIVELSDFSRTQRAEILFSYCPVIPDRLVVHVSPVGSITGVRVIDCATVAESISGPCCGCIVHHHFAKGPLRRAVHEVPELTCIGPRRSETSQDLVKLLHPFELAAGHEWLHGSRTTVRRRWAASGEADARVVVNVAYAAHETRAELKRRSGFRIGCAADRVASIGAQIWLETHGIGGLHIG